MKFVGKCPWLLTGICVLILVPCFGHKHIEACDLGSHVYNAWFAVLGNGHNAGISRQIKRMIM